VKSYCPTQLARNELFSSPGCQSKGLNQHATPHGNLSPANHGSQTVRAFIPLPPARPPLVIDGELFEEHVAATLQSYAYSSLRSPFPV
jgi:hypothetical protein